MQNPKVCCEIKKLFLSIVWWGDQSFYKEVLSEKESGAGEEFQVPWVPEPQKNKRRKILVLLSLRIILPILFIDIFEALPSAQGKF